MRRLRASSSTRYCTPSFPVAGQVSHYCDARFAGFANPAKPAAMLAFAGFAQVSKGVKPTKRASQQRAIMRHLPNRTPGMPNPQLRCTQWRFPPVVQKYASPARSACLSTRMGITQEVRPSGRKTFVVEYARTLPL